MAPSLSFSSTPSSSFTSSLETTRLAIAGNVSPVIKEAFVDPAMIFPTLDHDGKYRVLGFAMRTVFQRVVVTEISSCPYSDNHSDLHLEKPSEKTRRPFDEAADGKREGDGTTLNSQSVRLVCEVDVLPEMVNNSKMLHGGCTAFLIDMCSSLACVALEQILKSTKPNTDHYPQKFSSQSMNVVYHSPSPLGDKLRIVSTTLPRPTLIDGDDLATSVCIRTEIWSLHHHRLVGSGILTVMASSESLRSQVAKSRL